MVGYNIGADLESVKYLLECSDAELSSDLGVSEMTIERWRDNDRQITEKHIRDIYDYAYSRRIRLNAIKQQLYKEEYCNSDSIVLFHGAKQEIVSELSLTYSRETNDFGRGFYCGDSLEQSAMFVSTYPNSSVYIVKFDSGNKMKSKKYAVDRDWMLTIANCRRRIDEFAHSEIITNLMSELKECDYVIAPIADNRMFQLIDEFAEGLITDVQCQHALSATNLGMQYVFLSERALDNIELLTRCYLTEAEKDDYLRSRQTASSVSLDKVKIAKRMYRNEGLYIEEILK